MTRLLRPRRRLAATVLALGLLVPLAAAVAPLAWARSDKLVVYAPEKVFPTAVRFLRIDIGAKIVEKDADAGYVMFELTEGGKTFPGSLELVAADANGRVAARVVIKIEGQPSYVEVVMLDKLELKLRAELGAPAPAPPARARIKEAPAPSPAPAQPVPPPGPAPGS